MRLVARPSGPIRSPDMGRVRPPGDKSISHRALLFGALADGVTTIDGLLEGEDVLCTAAAMRAFGAGVTRSASGRWTVVGHGAAGFAEPAGPIDFGNSGTGVRLTMGAAAAFPIAVTYTGDASLSGRPMGRILDPLALMGARWTARDKGLLPATVQGGALKAIAYASPHASAQIKSAILLAGLGADGLTSVTEPRASRDHTERMLRAFGAEVSETNGADGRHTATVTGGARLRGQPVAVPADPSSAAFLAAAALIVPGSEVILDDVCLNPLRTGFFDTIADMGGGAETIEARDAGGEPVGTLRVRAPQRLRGAAPPEARAASMIDEYPILSALAAFADGETTLSGAAELRVKESDRIALMVEGLHACGVDADERPDGLVIHGRGPGGVPGGATVRTHGDHRIAMSFLILGLGAQAPVVVEDAEMIATSFPGFADLMRSLGADISEA
ncbi:MAG: 3-phosphoshikimate 1-carboxyvinyltransferase [Hyphomonadaceae bacterium]|nr:3-phosphoshikimate 1-carboxyvinyltransferase [Hyphomonadaceae bacterium]